MLDSHILLCFYQGSSVPFIMTTDEKFHRSVIEMTERGDSRAVQPKVTQQTFEESGKLKSFDESGKFRRFDSELYNKGASRTSLGVTNSISHSSYNSANEVMTFTLENLILVHRNCNSISTTMILAGWRVNPQL